MQRHEVPLRGAESWGGGGWGRTASAPPCGRVRAVWRRCPVPRALRARSRLLPLSDHETSYAGSRHGRPRGSCGRPQGSPLRIGIGRIPGAGAVRRQPNVARRNHGRDRVLVYHLADRVAEYDNELVERLDLTLQLDPVNQIDGYRGSVPSQRVEIGILQRLPFRHPGFLVRRRPASRCAFVGPMPCSPCCVRRSNPSRRPAALAGAQPRPSALVLYACTMPSHQRFCKTTATAAGTSTARPTRPSQALSQVNCRFAT